ncbi:MAG: electron transfer flavoprotein subunit alpha/FixB family protein [Thermoflexus sp.]|jgi:electron transfer flavoprotein alpha subunit|nr:electron transfer flavoprotein subunit alpha/FixB family protein [Thermoflexus sp.]MDT7947206.1 electron transfer flavoprotein subunit alpha/FixB family protein [Thermoflexus sp.]
MQQEVLVVAETLKGRWSEVTFELLAAGKALARDLGGPLSVVAMGDGITALAKSLGAADLVLCAEDPALADFNPEAYLSVLEAVISQRAPRVILVANTSMGMDLAAPLAVRTGLPLVAYCRRAWVEDGKIVAQSQIYGGKIMAEVVLEERGILSVLTGSFPGEAGKVEGEPNVQAFPVPPLEGVRTKVMRLMEPEAADVDITRQEILVAIGRGIGDKENLYLAEELAEALGGVVCASRPIIDYGWLPKTRQVGKSGLTVKPKLYLAAGISGAPEHIEGMKDSELIIAINTDPRAPIFDVAHYGVVGDLFDLLPALTEAIRERKG